jgi:hypothetical protein
MSKVNLENLVYKKPKLVLGTDLLNRIHFQGTMTGEEDIGITPGDDPDPYVGPGQSDVGSDIGNIGTGGE